MSSTLEKLQKKLCRIICKQKKQPNFFRSIKSIEHEIIHQILLVEIAINICKEIPKTSGMGPNILPYFYNLNYCKAVTLLHSLLLSKIPDEITLKNYIKQYEWEYDTTIDKNFRKSINKLASKFSSLYKVSLRHKIAAHIDQGFIHTPFTSAYIIPEKLNELSDIGDNLKEVFSVFTNFQKDQRPYDAIVRQVKKCITEISKTS